MEQNIEDYSKNVVLPRFYRKKKGIFLNINH